MRTICWFGSMAWLVMFAAMLGFGWQPPDEVVLGSLFFVFIRMLMYSVY